MICYLCNSEKIGIKHKGVRDNPNINVKECQSCGLVSLDSFLHISDSFYEDSKMHNFPISIDEWLNQTKNDDSRRINDLGDLIRNKTVLDFGSGNGGFLIKAKELSKEVMGIEPEKQFKSFFKDNGIRIYDTIDQLKSDMFFDLITAFHVFEHLKDPLATLKNLMNHLSDDGQIIIEVPNADDALLSLYDCDSFAKFTYWSQHLFLFNENTMKDLVAQSDCKLNWIKQIQRYPISNHLYWLSKGLPGGHKKWTSLDKINHHYVEVLRQKKICDTIMVSIKKMN